MPENDWGLRRVYKKAKQAIFGSSNETKDKPPAFSISELEEKMNKRRKRIKEEIGDLND